MTDYDNPMFNRLAMNHSESIITTMNERPLPYFFSFATQFTTGAVENL